MLLLAIAGIAPILTMFAQSFVEDGKFSVEFYRNLFASARTWGLLGNSVILGAITAFLSTLLGVPVGILLGKSDLPLRRLFTTLFILPLLIPPYIVAVAWYGFFGPDASRHLFGLPGCVLVLTSTFLPIVMLTTMATLRAINPRMEEAGCLIEGPYKVLWHVTIPLIAPGIFLATTLVFLLAVGEFGAPAFLRYDVFPVESFIQFSAFYDFGAATAAAMPLAVLTLAVFGVEKVLLRGRTLTLRPSAGGEMIVVRLGRYRPLLLAAIALLCLIVIVIPLASLAMASGSIDALGRAMTAIGSSLRRSIIMSAAGATVLTIVGFFLGYLIHERAIKIWRTIDLWTVLLLAMPSTVIAIGLISLWNRPATNLIYATPLIVILGYVAQYTALTSRMTVAGLSLVPKSMEEAAAVAGMGWPQRVRSIVLPLLRTTLLAGWLIAYIFCLRDTGMTMLVYPPGQDTLPVRIFTLMANGAPDMIAAACIVLIGATVVPLALLGLLLYYRASPSWR